MPWNPEESDEDVRAWGFSFKEGNLLTVQEEEEEPSPELRDNKCWKPRHDDGAVACGNYTMKPSGFWSKPQPFWFSRKMENAEQEPLNLFFAFFGCLFFFFTKIEDKKKWKRNSANSNAWKQSEGMQRVMVQLNFLQPPRGNAARFALFFFPSLKKMIFFYREKNNF